jgi:hypothetical protein
MHVIAPRMVKLLMGLNSIMTWYGIALAYTVTAVLSAGQNSFLVDSQNGAKMYNNARLANLCNSSLVLLGNLLDDGIVKDTWVIILLHRTSGIAQRRVGLKYDACIECMQTTSNQKTSTEFITTTIGKQWDVLHPQHDHTSEGNICPPLP